MLHSRVTRRATLAVWGVLVLSTAHVRNFCPAAEDSKSPERDQRSRHRLELMQSTIDDLKIDSRDIQQNSALKAGRTPLLRYNDPTRSLESTAGLLDAGV